MNLWIAGVETHHEEDLTTCDPNETKSTDWDVLTDPDGIYTANTGYDYARRSISAVNTINPEDRLGIVPGFDDLQWQPNLWAHGTRTMTPATG